MISLPFQLSPSPVPVQAARLGWFPLLTDVRKHLRLWIAPALLALAAPLVHGDSTAEYADFYTGKDGAKTKTDNWVQSISVSAPPYCSEIKGDTTVTFTAPGMTHAQVLCWQQPSEKDQAPSGHDAVVADLTIDPSGAGSFVFHADQFPNGPIILRIQTKGAGDKQDTCQLQLFNQGGAVWNQGIPKTDPPAAKGMKIAFSDDFDQKLSVSVTGDGATYEGHKTGGGDFSGWPFTSPGGALDPFGQVGTWLRIHASKPPGTKGSTGILSSAHEDGTGFLAKAPAYFECRLIAQSAPGTWPAFWLLTKKKDPKDKKEPTVELDIIEAYGGMGPKNPNSNDYACTSHIWGQPRPAWQLEKGRDGKQVHPAHVNVPMTTLGDKSTWSTTFHTYGCLITPTDTVYYLDDIEVLRHPTHDVSKTEPFFFMINYAIGGISRWHIDLARYGQQSDMWVDYVRVYTGEATALK